MISFSGHKALWEAAQIEPRLASVRTLHAIRAARMMLESLTDCGITATPDGAPYSISAIRAAMVGM